MKLSRIINRILDILVSIFLLSFLWPFMLIISIAIKLEDNGSIFADIPNRIGLAGKEFFMYKFRSMIPHAHEEMQNDKRFKNLKENWDIQEKLSINNDPRITKVGKIIRRCDIDETPQLFNVLLGDMSIVGPRPFNRQQLNKYTSSSKKISQQFEIIKTVKPGITGIWQVSGRNKNTIEERFEMDKNYVEKKNIFLDIWIMIKTPFEILRHIILGEE